MSNFNRRAALAEMIASTGAAFMSDQLSCGLRRQQVYRESAGAVLLNRGRMAISCFAAGPSWRAVTQRRR